MLTATAAEEALQGSVTKLVGSIFDSVRAQLESETVRKQRENDLEIEAVVTQLLDDVFASALTKGGHEQQQQQQQQQQPALALAPAPAPAPVPRRSMLDAVGDFMGSMSSLFGGGKQEQAQEQAQKQEEAQEEGAQNGSSPPPLPPDALATEVGEWVADVVGRVFEQARSWLAPSSGLSLIQALALSLTQAPALSRTRTCGVPPRRPATKWTRRRTTLQSPRSRHEFLPTYARRVRRLGMKETKYGAAHASTQPVAPGLEGKAEAEAKTTAQQVGWSAV